MTPKQIRISKRVCLNIIETDKFKSNYISVNFITPLKRENASFDALLPAVLTRGTEAFPTLKELNRRLDLLYGIRLSTDCTKNGSDHVFGVGLSMLDNAYVPDGTDITAGAVAILDQIINHPLTENGAFNALYVEQEKHNLCERIEAQILHKPRYAINKCNLHMCENEDCGTQNFGECEQVLAITPNSLYGYYCSLLGACRIEVFCVGSFSERDIAALGALFVRDENTYAATDEKIVLRAPEQVRRVSEAKAVVQATLAMGFRTATAFTDSDCAALRMFNEILGASSVSKLFMNVRERLSLCYYCQSMASLRCGIMYVVAGVDAANIDRTIDAVNEQIAAVAAGDISDAELEAARSGVSNSYRSINDSPAALENWYLSRMLAGVRTDPENDLEALLNVGKDEIARAAAKVSLDTVFVLHGENKLESEDDR